MTQSFVPSKAQPVLRTAFLIAAICLFLPVFSQHKMERLNRGVIAVHQDDGVFISWRLLETDNPGTAFDIYRQTDNGALVKLNKQPLTGPTHFTDKTADLSKKNTWSVRVSGSKEGESHANSFTLPAGSPVQQYISIPLKGIEGYAPNDCSIGDLDGDGDYELVVHMGGRMMDNSFNGTSSTPILQAYELDGTFMWEINLGINIRDGAHYTQFMVYDLDGDGKAELACKTADGTVDGKGHVIGDASKDWRGTNGKILDGPEYFTIFSGATGEQLATTDYIPNRYPLDGWGGWGGNGENDNNGNRADRFLACVAYLDGQMPSVVMCRGYYGRSVLAAWDYRNGKLTSRWVFDSKERNNPFSGQGNHNIAVADVDSDGKDEIIYGSMVVDHDGKGLFSTGFRHGDALHVGDLDPDSPGLEVFGVHENEAEGLDGATGPGAALFSAKDGEVLFRMNEGVDAGRGVAEDIWDGNRGAEVWFSGSRGLLNTQGRRIGDAPRSTNFLIWWDGELTRQLLDGNRIERYGKGVIFTAEGCRSNNGSKSTPALSADIWGDWREELILRSEDNKELRIYTTTIPTSHRVTTLMHDPVYRIGVACENVGYNQPPHLSYWLAGALADNTQIRPLLKYDFQNSEGNVIRDVSGSGLDGTLRGSAKLEKTDYTYAVNLGYDGGYIDMGGEIGRKLKSLSSFTIAVKYLVDEKASLLGNGYFLWAFSTLEQNTQDKGRYQAYKLNSQCCENSIGGWSRETLMRLDKPSEKGKWKHAVYTQDGKFGRLYIDGNLAAFNNDMFTMSRTFDREQPRFNWIGRAPFNGDSFLAGTHIADVRIFGKALADREVRTLTNEVMRENLSAHNFMYCGESKSRKIFKIEDGRIVWRYDNPSGRGEISDAILMDDQHILIADQFGAAELDADGNELWRIKAPENTEIHTLHPVGKKHVLYILQQLPAAKVIVRRISDMKIVNEFDIPVSQEGKVHFQFRCARLTKNGTLLIAHMGDGGITEWNSRGKMIARWDVPGPWGVCELDNGNILTVSNQNYVREFTRDGKTVWEKNLAPYGCTIPQKAYRLENGNTVVTNWFSEWDEIAMSSFDASNPPVQIIEISPEGKLVWQMASWKEMGPATTFQPIEKPVVRSSCHFGNIK